MARLKDILEPGETVAIEMPGRGNSQFWMGLGAFLMVIEVGVAMAMHTFLGMDRFYTGIVMWATLVLVWYLSTRWRLVVTNRRLLHRHGPFLSRLEVVGLDKIDEVRTEMGSFTERLVIRAAGHETVIKTLGIDHAPIVKTLNHAKEALA